MKTERQVVDILRFTFRQEKEDRDYGSCLWAIFDIDAATGSLNIQSDCGNYSYRWPERGERFLELLAGMGKDRGYLLRKLAGEPKDTDKSSTIENVRRYFPEEKDIDSAIEDLERRLYDYSFIGKELLAHIIYEWAEEHGLDTADLWECISVKYAPQEERIVDIFCSSIVPEIKASASSADNAGTGQGTRACICTGPAWVPVAEGLPDAPRAVHEHVKYMVTVEGPAGKWTSEADWVLAEVRGKKKCRWEIHGHLVPPEWKITAWAPMPDPWEG